MIAESEAPTPSAPEWLSVRQVAITTGIDRKTVYEALLARELPGTQRRDRGTWKIHRDDVEAWMEARKRHASWLTPGQVQERTGYGRTFVYEALQTGDLPAEKEGGKWLVDPAAVAAWMRTRTPPAPT